MMKIEKKIDRRRFLKKGLCFGLAAGLLPLWSKAGGEETGENVRPEPARHWRELAG